MQLKEPGMKKAFVVIVVLGAMLAVAQQQPGQPAAPPSATSQQPGQQPAQPGQQPGGQPAQKKEIKDPAEYQAYVAALQTADPRAKATALEGFIERYPNSVVKTDALEALMGAYQQANDPANLQKTAQRLLQVDPNNFRGLLIMSVMTRSQIESGQNAAAVPQLAQQELQFSQRGLQALEQAPPPEGVDPTQWNQQKAVMTSLFNSNAGFAALQVKDYARAQQYLGTAVQANPNDMVANYQLALSYLEQQPVNTQGFWYGARAVGLAQSPEQANAITRYVRSKYVRFHGDDSGFQELLAQAKSSPQAPPNLNITPAPTPPEQAAKMVASKAVKDMSFDEIQFILTAGNPQAAEQIWSQIKDRPIALEGKLLNLSPTKLTIAGTAEDIEGNKADIDLTMTDAIPAKALPVLKEGGMVQFQGTPRSYEPNPFMMHMDAGSFVLNTGKAVAAALKGGAATKPGAAKGAATKKGASKSATKSGAAKKGPPK
jgi:tetratricopeptide (TPR) repeat protein